MARLDGDHGRLQIFTANAYANIATCKGVSLDMNSDQYDATVWADNNKVQITGKSNFSFSSEFVGDSDSLASTLVLMRTGATANSRIYPHATSMSNTYFEGPVNISGSLNVSQGAAIMGSIAGVAAGNIVFNEA